MKKFISLLVATQWLFFSIFPVLAEDVPPPSLDDQNEESQQADELPQDPDPEPLPDPTPPDEEENVEELLQDEPVDELPTVRLNEVLADPIEPEAEGEFIELYNFGEEAIDLSGWRLDDENLEDNLAYHFDNPELDYVLEPDAFLTLFRPETNITLNNDGDSVHLFDPNDQEVDAFIFDSTSAGRSWGRSIGDSDHWILFPTPTPDAENSFENHPPVADIHVQGGTGGMKLNVTGEGSADPDGDKLTYLWEFEPGQTSMLENPATYTFLTPGNKEVTLSVTDEFGATGEIILPFLAVDPNAQNVPDTPQTSSGNTGNQNEPSSDTPKMYPKLTLINEILPDPVGADGDGEWVELYNSTDQVIDLSGWYLDDEEGASVPFQIPDGTTLATKSYVVFQGPVMSLSLKNSADVVRLLDPNKTEIQRVDYADSHEGLSYAKNSEGEFVWTPLLTPGKLNAFPPPPQAYAPGVIRFESVLPNPKGTDTGKEKIVLKNTSDQAINLAGWVMAMGSTEKTLSNIQISPNSKQELISDQFGLTLKNTDGTLSLYDPTHQLIDQITWKTAGDDQWLFNTNSLQDGMLAKVVEVVDGDTFKITFEGRAMVVRLLGVDTPETVHPFKPVEFYGKQASDHFKTLLTGQSVRLEFDENKTDTYGRVLAYVYLGDAFVNKEIILDGFGYAYTRFPFRYLNDFVAYQEEAKAAGRGLWADPEVGAAIEKAIQEDLSEPLEEVPQRLVDLTANISPDSFGENSTNNEVADSETADTSSSTCSSVDLKIDSFIPSPKSGETESITLINRGDHEICLGGWSLDDVLDGGSKPFLLTEGRMGAGEKATFNKEITKLSLNNSDDCVTLINPSGETADQICYESTHEGEIFTHEGGNWVSSKATVSTTTKKSSAKTTSAKKSVSAKSSSAKSSTPKYAFSRESSSYRSELSGRTIVGKIIGMDEQEKMLVVQLQDEKITPIAYGSSLMDVKMLKSLLQLDKNLSFDVYDTADFPQLISVHDPDQLHGTAPKKTPAFLMFFAIPALALGLLIWKKRAFLLLLKSSLARRLGILKE